MKTAVITGGAGGLGQALAKGLQAQGWRTALVDLDGPALAALAETDQQKPYSCDLTDAAAFAVVCDQIRRDHQSIDMVIYNAGVTQIGLFAQSDAASQRQVFEVNFFAATACAWAFLHDIRASKGVHLAISSVAGFTPLYKRTAYAASKHALEGFFASLAAEELAFGVQTSIAAPSFVATNPGNAERQDNGIARPGSATDGIDYMPPDKAAAIILKGVAKRRAFIPVGRVALLSYLINRLSPRLFFHLMLRKMKAE